jgi:sugar/nucleoside kinase (ribokinase family)/D-arabinose 5-phosphate isomerase GutQ
MTTNDADLDVVGIGSMAVDRVHRTPRILAGGEKGMLRDVEGAGPVRLYVGGVVLNHLGWAAVLGLRTGICGRQANDEGGRFLRAAMARTGIESHIHVDPEGAASTIAEIFLDDSGERTIYMAPGATSETTREHVRKEHGAFLGRARTVTTEISQLPLEAALEALTVAREAGATTIVDFDVPASAAVESLGDEATLTAVLEAADVLKPAKIAGRELFPDLADDALALARAIRERFGNQAVVMTDGEGGCAIASDDYEGVVPACSAKAIDSTGAGDAFLGGLLVARHHGLGWEDVGRFANACGAACIEQMGAFPEDPLAARARVESFYSGTPSATAFALSLPGAAMDSAFGSESAGLRSLVVAARELGALAERHDGESLLGAARLIEAALAASGRVHVTGLGKPEHISHYAASLFSSTGTPATFLHTTEATHGSLGQVVEGDVVVAISNSGTTREVVELAELLGARGVKVIAVTGSAGSPLARAAHVVLDAGVDDEGGPLGLAPRASIGAQVAILAALSALLQDRSGFSREDYAVRHPGGALGERARK